MDATLLITRALNHLQRQYVPSYLGLRILAESTSKQLRNDWTIGYVDRRSVTRRRQAYWKYSGVKGQDDKGKLEYRHFVVGSPTTVLAECRLISMISQWPQFARHPAVYSYLWPFYGKGGHLFAHFFYGYRKRERDVAEAVKQFPDHTCIVLDLKNFYPSVNKESPRMAQLEQSGNSLLQELIDERRQIERLGPLSGAKAPADNMPLMRPPIRRPPATPSP